MSFKTVILAQHGDLKVFAYETPCGILTYYKGRKRHDWVVTFPDGTEKHYGEDYSRACDAGLKTPGCGLRLLLDGEPLMKHTRSR